MKTKNEKVIFIKSLTSDFKGTNTGFDWSPYLPVFDGEKHIPGEWTPVVNDIELCERGWHFTDNKNWTEWKSHNYYLVEYAGKIIKGDNKYVAEKIRLLSPISNDIWHQILFPEGLKVGGSLDLRGTQITALPEGLEVGEWLDLSGTQITALPEGLKVGGSLDLRGTQITALPEGLKVGGSLDLRGTQITALPEGLKKRVIR
jgi:hypothetical protein